MTDPTRHARAQPPDPAAADTRSPSLWPESTRPAPLHTQFGLEAAMSHFDPLADERARERTQAAAAFDVCHAGLALRLVLAVQGVAAAGVLVADPRHWVAAQAAVSFAALAGTLLWLVLLCAGRAGLPRLRPAVRAAAVLALGAVCGVAGALPMWWLWPGSASPAQALGIALAGAGCAAVAWAWLRLRARLWQPVQDAARLAELQSRIRPHFLFNALNTALALVRLDPDRAERVLEDLSELFREALAESGASVSLDQEIELAQRYLAIEQVRFGERLRVAWHVDPRAGRARVPPLVLQPLVENAVRHGVEPARDGGRIEVRASVAGGQAVVLVSNSVGETPSRPGSGMALANVRERLRLLHDVAAQCDTWAEDGQFHARIVVPL